MARARPLLPTANLPLHHACGSAMIRRASVMIWYWIGLAMGETPVAEAQAVGCGPGGNVSVSARTRDPECRGKAAAAGRPDTSVRPLCAAPGGVLFCGLRHQGVDNARQAR